MTFDPNGPAEYDSYFGIPPVPDARIAIIPVPFEATVSSGGGTARGPGIVREASAQVDLHDMHFGSVWRVGFDECPPVEVDQDLEPDAAAEAIRALLHGHAADLIRIGQAPIVLGGEHSVSLGAVEACAEAVPAIGVLQIDAHMDLRDAYEGYRFSHASIARNILERCPTVTSLIQVGIRDCCDEERSYAADEGERVRVLDDVAIWRHIDSGGSFRSLAEGAIETLPEHVYITFDIDGLDPALCANTGTPVPGGLTFQQAAALLEAVAESGRRVVGADLVEISPGTSDGRWDGNVGARILYKLAGCIGKSQGWLKS
ncbi:MAG: agmatinase family protein [Planctomycetota bacterium]